MTAAPSADDITLQINLCAGDLAYAERTVRALVATHRPDVREVVIVADACRPQSSPLLDAARRFPAAEFAARIDKLRGLCASLEAEGLVNRVAWLEPEAEALRRLNARYCGVATPCSHDHLGHAFSAYFLGWDSARTRFVAHFDADILLWQQRGFSWLRAAAEALQRDDSLVAASPRIAPPPDDGELVRVHANGSGWSPTWPLARGAHGWRSPWFSTRCHLLDRERLARVLPLRGRRPHGRDAAIDRMLRPLYAAGGWRETWLGRRIVGRIPPFPLPPEVLLHEHAQAAGFGCLYLHDPRAWFIHPDTKPDVFLRLLPDLLAVAAGRGEYPPAQRGVSGVQFAAWEQFLR